jgi:hypothetical protein
MIGSINSKLRDRYGNPSDFSRVQWLANLRAEFDHDKGVEPSADKAREFIDSIATFVSTTN